jgi:predicted transcriptional regulator
MECGRKQKTLKRHLENAHGMSPEQYRNDYGLPRDYPMVAPEYSKKRSQMAHAIGLGRKPKEEEAPPPAPAKPSGRGGRRAAAPSSGGRKRKAAAATE